MASASGEMSAAPGDIRRQVNQFLQGTSSSGPVSYEALSSSALFLLRTVPVARHAVLKHYAVSFDEAVSMHLNMSDHPLHTGLDTDNAQRIQLTALQDVTTLLLSFIKSNPEAWAPVVSSWALSLLGEMSSKYAGRRGVQHATSINEILHMWMSCPPAKMLIEITTECFAAMVGAAPDMCVDSLLEASVKFSPHFDWVVAHIGSCFPRTIITRVLNCGLKDFCSSGVEGAEKDISSSRMKIPKMASVVGILGHLASKHSQDIRKALSSLFEASLQSETVNSSVSTLPFLLQLASMSDMLLQILTSDLVSALTPPVLNLIHRQFTHWKHASPTDYNSFLNLVVHLIGKCKTGSFDVVSFILRTAVPQDDYGGGQVPVEEVRDTCVEIMHILLFELQRGVLSRKTDGSVVEISLLTGLASQVESLTRLLLHSQGTRVPWLQKLLTFTALQAGENCAAAIMTSVVFTAQIPTQLAAFYRLKQGIELGIPNIIQVTLVHIFNKLESLSFSCMPSVLSASPSSSPSTSLQLLPVLRNLERIVHVEKVKINNRAMSVSTIIKGLRQRHSTLCDFLLSSDPEICMCVLRLMHMAGFPPNLSTAQLTRICGVIALTFFTSIHKRVLDTASENPPKSNRMTQLCMSCIEQLSNLPFTRSLLIHYLLEGAVLKDHCHLFGGRWSQIPFLSSSSAATTSTTASSLTDTVSLMDENRQQSLSIALPRFHSSVYHGGVIRQSAANLQSSGKALPKELVARNCLTFVETLWLCSREMKEPIGQQTSTDPSKKSDEPMETDQMVSSRNPTISESSARTLGCIIVDILTLDSLYNDVHWQDPDFRKVTTERDTLVWKRLESLPLLWDVIQEFSSSCVFMYYLSPVLRSLMAVIMNHLEVSREARLKNCPKYHDAAVKLVYCLAQGSMVPPPLSNMAELFPFVSPYEGYLLLLALWRYIKDNPPSEFVNEVTSRTCDSSHMCVVNSIIHANIDHMGHLCLRMFNM
ncbi:hypothetical protein BsWGS_09047 [Bradybaena similaris]